MLEIDARCGCGRQMRLDALQGRGHLVCGCGARVYVNLPAAEYRQPGICTWVSRVGKSCPEPVYDRALSICESHLRLVVEYAAQHRMRLAARSVERRSSLRQLAADIESPPERQAAVLAASRLERERNNAAQQRRRLEAMVDAASSVVYYLRLREGVIKIGYSGNLETRISNLHVPDEAVLAAEPGGREVEADRHRQFAAVRVGGRSREHFADGGELAEWIDHLRMQYGPALDLARRLRVLKIADLRINGPLLYPRNRDLYDALERARPAREAAS